jgi:hypothetical protein
MKRQAVSSIRSYKYSSSASLTQVYLSNPSAIKTRFRQAFFSLCVVATAVLGALPALSEGSVSFKGVSSLILSQDPRIKGILLKGMLFEPTGTAPRLGSQFPHSGCRIPPYSFIAKAKGWQTTNNLFDLLVTVNAYTVFLDKDGKELDGDSPAATHLKIYFENVDITPRWPAGYSPNEVGVRGNRNSKPSAPVPMLTYSAGVGGNSVTSKQRALMNGYLPNPPLPVSIDKACSL